MGIICHLYVHISILYTLCVYVCVCVCVGACVGVHRSLHGNNNTIVFYDWWWVSCCSFSFKTDSRRRKTDRWTDMQADKRRRQTDGRTNKQQDTCRRTNGPIDRCSLSCFPHSLSVCLYLYFFLFLSPTPWKHIQRYIQSNAQTAPDRWCCKAGIILVRFLVTIVVSFCFFTVLFLLSFCHRIHSYLP